MERASPGLAFEYRSQLLDSLVSIGDTTSPQEVAVALEALDLKPTLARLKSDHLMQQMIALSQEDEKATVDGLARLINGLSGDRKSALLVALQNVNRSPGA
jgi:acetyl-CoA carboxylase/biotin carboxylase 1